MQFRRLGNLPKLDSCRSSHLPTRGMPDEATMPFAVWPRLVLECQPSAHCMPPHGLNVCSELENLRHTEPSCHILPQLTQNLNGALRAACSKC
jgi:hypothetical protein